MATVELPPQRNLDDRVVCGWFGSSDMEAESSFRIHVVVLTRASGRLAPWSLDISEASRTQAILADAICPGSNDLNGF